ncbi:hypothetical protein [Salinisphaera sp.]|uniref:hypothetical protein n=1 Tax=Salinisphaera sp. TaxID=1914330 RepID=UPI002D786B29|nr:hypothetical protein [Salinisphaera sp.]HET7313226.1 hypothetical protein [Salinisphaera sp.]
MSRLSIEIPDDVHRQIKAQASLRGLSMRDYVLRRLKAGGLSDSGETRRRFSQAGLASIWADRDDLKDPDAWLRGQRQPRSFDVPPDAD